MLSVVHSQYHGCWCPGDFRSQGISRHGIDPLSRNIPSPASEELTTICVGIRYMFLKNEFSMARVNAEKKYAKINPKNTEWNWPLLESFHFIFFFSLFHYFRYVFVHLLLFYLLNYLYLFSLGMLFCLLIFCLHIFICGGSIIKSPRYTGGDFMFLPLSPPGWRGIVVTVRAAGRAGGRAGGCQTCGTHISVTAWWIFSVRSSMELSRPVVVHCHAHLPICPIWACPWAENLSNLPQIGSRLCGSHISETAGWIYPHLKFHGLV